jgi:hypothetical protein
MTLLDALLPDLDAVPAGPEMDRMVAVEVMGWEAVIGNPGTMWPGRCQVRNRLDAPCEADRWTLWCPSTDIAHAWRVVARMANYRNEKAPALWWNCTAGAFICIPGFDTAGGAGMSFGRIMYERPQDMPLAICRAALMAVRA